MSALVALSPSTRMRRSATRYRTPPSCTHPTLGKKSHRKVCASAFLNPSVTDFGGCGGEGGAGGGEGEVVGGFFCAFFNFITLGMSTFAIIQQPCIHSGER